MKWFFNKLPDPGGTGCDGKQGSRLRIRAIDASACYNRLCGLEGAIQGIRWHYLEDNLKKELKDFYEANR